MNTRRYISATLCALIVAAFLSFPGRGNAQETEVCPANGQKVEVMWGSWLGATNNPDHQPWSMSMTLSGVAGQWTFDQQGVRTICLPPDFDRRSQTIHFVLQPSDPESNELWFTTLALPHYWSNHQVGSVFFDEMPFWSQKSSDAKSWGNDGVRMTMKDLDVTLTWVD